MSTFCEALYFPFFCAFVPCRFRFPLVLYSLAIIRNIVCACCWVACRLFCLINSKRFLISAWVDFFPCFGKVSMPLWLFEGVWGEVWGRRELFSIQHFNVDSCSRTATNAKLFYGFKLIFFQTGRRLLSVFTPTRVHINLFLLSISGGFRYSCCPCHDHHDENIHIFTLFTFYHRNLHSKQFIFELDWNFILSLICQWRVSSERWFLK